MWGGGSRHRRDEAALQRADPLPAWLRASPQPPSHTSRCAGAFYTPKGRVCPSSPSPPRPRPVPAVPECSPRSRSSSRLIPPSADKPKKSDKPALGQGLLPPAGPGPRGHHQHGGSPPPAPAQEQCACVAPAPRTRDVLGCSVPLYDPAPPGPLYC